LITSGSSGAQHQGKGEKEDAHYKNEAAHGEHERTR
jgi:hypothetical protein